MLYLARKVGESIIINNSIELTVMEIRGNSVKLGFQFPADASVLRKELYDKITSENRASYAPDAEDAWEALDWDQLAGPGEGTAE